MSLRVGITGGIGSGKTALTDQLAKEGIAIIDADVVAREVVEPGSDALALIVDRFGDEILLGNGALDRAALRKIVFSDEQQRLWLESVTHPRIAERIRSQLESAASSYVVLSSPLLLEGSQRQFVDYVVVVDVPEGVQLTRTQERDGNSEALVRSIMAAQLARQERLKGADKVIDNSGSLDDLRRQAAVLHEELMTLAGRGT